MEGNMARATQGSEPQDLESKTDEELRALQEQITELLDERVRSRFAEYRRIARDAGYEVTLTRIGEEGRTRRRGQRGGREDRRSEIAPKYRNPDNPSETWTGRGREPRWMQHQIAEGKSRDDFLISKPESGEPAS
jgi:DNA-binding protein H-NS